MEFTRVAPEMESVYPGQYWWAVLRALSDDDLGAACPGRDRGVPAGPHRVRRRLLALVDAVVLGRQGRGADASAARGPGPNGGR